jgi:hypothetical protein
MGASTLAFADWASAEGLTFSNPIDGLRDKKILVDAEQWLDILLTAQPYREPLLPALGGLPFALKKHIDAHLTNLKDARITPTFVFNGLDLTCRDRAAISRQSRVASTCLNEAWGLYGQGKADDAVAEFGKSCKQLFGLLQSC